MVLSTGSAKQMYDVYSKSLEARISDLKRAFEDLYEKMLSSDSLKWLVTESTQLVTALSNVDGKTIAFIGTVGLATVAISKLVTMNKLLMETTSANTIVGGFTKFVGILTGMTPLMGTTTVATEALVLAQAEATVATEALAQAEARALLATEALTVAQEGQATSSFAVGVAEAEVMLATDALTVAQGRAVVTTEALAVAEGAVVAESAGLTGVAGAWTLITGGIQSAVVASLEFMATPLGLAITALAIVVGVAGKAFYDYKQHQAEVETQSKSLKDAINGVNEALKNGDTKGASDKLDKLAESEKKYQDALEKKKKIEAEIKDTQDNMNSYNSDSSVIKLSELNSELEDVNKELDTHEEAFKKAGVSANDYANAQQLVKDSKIADTIKEETKAQVEHRSNVEANTQEYKNYISTVQDLYSQYQTLSAQENLSSEQKQQLASVVEQLQGKIGNLDSQMDSNGKTYITNTGLITDTISYLNSEGQTVETLTQIKLADEKSNASWQWNNTSMTYTQTLQRIQYYQSEVKNIQALMAAREASQTSETGMSEDGKSFELTPNEKKRRQTANQDQIDSMNDKIKGLQAGKDAIDKIYTSMTLPTNKVPSISSPNTNYMPSGGGSGKDSAKKAEDELKASEKKMIDDITDAYNKAKDIISNDIEEIDAKITGLGDADDSNFTQRVSLTSQKIDEQSKIVSKAQEQLDALKNVTVTTAEAQEALETATLKASKELRNETLEVSKLQSEIEKADIEELKKIYEDRKELEEATLDSQQKKQTQDLENIKTQQEELHQTKMDNYEAELNALDEQSEKLDEENSQVERQNELQKEQNDLKQKEIDLERLKNQKTIQTYSKDANGNWNFSYTYDKKAVADKQKEVDEAQSTLDETNRKNALEDAKKEIENEKKQIEELKTAEDKAYEEKKKYLDKYSEDLKEAQDRDKKRIEANYSDIEKLAKDTLKSLEEEHNKNWNSIAESISTTVTNVTKQLNDLKTLQANYTTTEIDEAINSGDISGFLEKNKNKLNQTAGTNIADINKHLNEIDATAKNTKVSIDDLTDSYVNLSSAKKENEITDEDISDRKTNVTKITTIDFDGLSQQLENLKDINSKIKSELDSFYSDKLNKQNQAQNEELASLNKFSQEYLLFTDKFLELLQLVYDFRFNNVIINVSGAVNQIIEGLKVIAKAYEEYASAWNTMHPDDEIPSSVDMAGVNSANTNYQKSVSDYQTNKLSLYTSDAFEKYASQIGDGISKNLLGKLNNYASSIGVSSNSSTINNKSTSSVSTTNVNINQLDVNTKDAQNLLNQLLTIVKNKTSLS